MSTGSGRGCGDRHLADRQMQREGRAVAAAPGHFAADADNLLHAGGVVARQVRVVLLAIRRRHQHGDVLSDDIAFRVAEQPLGRGIERLDAAVRVDDDDRVNGRLDDRPPPRLARAQPFFELDAAAQVVEHARELAFAADRHFAHRQVQRTERAVAPTARDLAADADDLGDARRQVARKIAVVILLVRRRHEHAHVAADDFRRGIA
jgi:hypothetical protein